MRMFWKFVEWLDNPYSALIEKQNRSMREALEGVSNVLNNEPLVLGSPEANVVFSALNGLD